MEIFDFMEIYIVLAGNFSASSYFLPPLTFNRSKNLLFGSCAKPSVMVLKSAHFFGGSQFSMQSNITL